MTEVMLIVALVGVAAIGVVGVVGNNNAAIVNASAHALAGHDAKVDGEKAENLHRTLATFGENEAAAADLDGDYSGMYGLKKPNGPSQGGGLVGVAGPGAIPVHVRSGAVVSGGDGGFGAP